MSQTIRGKLIWSDNKRKRFVTFLNDDGQEEKRKVRQAQLDEALRDSTEDKIEVHFERDEKGDPVRIRPKGEKWEGVEMTPEAYPQSTPGDPRREFYNPYNFAPALPRSASGTLADDSPHGHDHYGDGLYSGVIGVKLITATPLLILDAAKATVNSDRHKTFPVRIDSAGKPYLPPTSIKGMLRAAYEAVTNSRFGVFTGHGERLGRRMVSNEGLGLVPCRVEGNNIHLLPGSAKITTQRPNGPMYAAWLPLQLLRNVTPGTYVPRHGDAVSCRIELWERTPWHKGKKQYEYHKRFRYWKVLSLGRDRRSVPPTSPSQPVQPSGHSNHHTPVPGVEPQTIDGFACITNFNFDRKYNERVFFVNGASLRVIRTSEHDRLWQNLILNYRANQDLRRERLRPSALNRAGWSRHMTEDKELELTDGSLAYALVKASGTSWQILELFPVCISRRLFEASPEELLDKSLLPASRIDRLSPADRVFGWANQDSHAAYRGNLTNQEGNRAYRGNLRIGPVTCETPISEAIREFQGAGLPLAILGEPKPQQARFYVAKSVNGEAQPSGQGKGDAGYCDGKGLRGRKVYPHHKGLPKDYWKDPMGASTDKPVEKGGKHYIEYRRPDGPEQCSDQNRSIRGWINPGAVFSFDLHVTNLSLVELGALLWLLTLDAKYHLRLGGGKPLGFGSVHLEIDPDRTNLRDGQAWQIWYSTLDETTAPKTFADVQKEAVEAFQNAVGKPFEKVPFIRAFLRAAEGFDKPIHYPRKQPAPQAVGKSFEWFVANDKESQGRCLVLDNLADDQGLPYLQ